MSNLVAEMRGHTMPIQTLLRNRFAAFGNVRPMMIDDEPLHLDSPLYFPFEPIVLAILTIWDEPPQPPIMHFEGIAFVLRE